MMETFSFQWPWLALLIPLPWIINHYWPADDIKDDEDSTLENALIHPGLSRLEDAFKPTISTTSSSGFIQQLLLILLWFGLILSLMQPQRLEEHIEIKNRGYDLMLAVDVSRSMLALDFTVKGQRVNRMAVVKGVLDEFIKQRSDDRIGLILFGDGAYMQSPLTYDTVVVRNMLENAVPRIAGDGTAIGDAIGLAVKKLRERPVTSRVLILLTDGENTSGSLSPMDAALLADQYNIRIYVIGVGSLGEVPFPGQDGSITMEKMEIDEQLLKHIAKQTDGAYFRATDTKALEAIYQQINTLEKTEAETKTVSLPTPLYRWPLGFSMLILLMIAGLSLGREGRW